jgi:hypothetical protein
MNLDIVYKMIKYLSCGVMMFFILKYISNNNMSFIDIALVSVIASLVFAVVENGYSLLKDDKKTQKIDNTQCQSFCAMKEHMENINPTTNNIMSIPVSPPQASAMIPSNIMNSSSNAPSVSSEDAPSNAMIDNASSNSEEPNIELVKVDSASDKNLSDYDRFQTRFSEIIDEKKQQNKDFVVNSENISRNADASYNMPYKRRSPDITSGPTRTQAGVMKESEMKYNVVSYHTVPPNLNTGSFEYGYSFLPPANWYPTPPFPPVCVAEKSCPVCPGYTNGTNLELKEWDSSRRISPPDEINVKYIEEKLNSGR